jgi:hypothetical protein
VVPTALEARDRPARLGRVLVPIAVVSVLFTAWLAFDIGGAALTRAVDNSCFFLVSGGTGLLMRSPAPSKR